MPKLNLLVLTDHQTHSSENSIYALLKEMLKSPFCERIDVASRGIGENKLFFEKMAVKSLYGTKVHSVFHFTEDGRFFRKNLEKLALRNYDAVLMRLPYPVPEGFWQFLPTAFPNVPIINDPAGIEYTGSKAFLLNFPELCPPMQRCETIQEIDTFRQKFPIILKPIRSYGGTGIYKIEDEQVIPVAGSAMTFKAFAKMMQDKNMDYLGVKFLKNVDQGDKRIVVCGGKILGAALRKPQPGSWICNVAQGGTSHQTEPDEDEEAIIERIDPVLASHGVYFYGVDTLMGDEGKRVLSEINTASIGGLTKIEEYSGKPIVRFAANLLWDQFVARQ